MWVILITKVQTLNVYMHFWGNTLNSSKLLCEIVEFVHTECWKVCSHGTVFPSNKLVISLSGVQLTGFIDLSHVKTAIFDIVFWGFHIISVFVFIGNANNWRFQVSYQNPRLQFRSGGL